METNIKKSNKIPGCDQLTRPDEIAALSKYLGEIKRIQEEHTSLDKDSLELPNFQETETLEDTIIQGRRGEDVNLGEQIIGLGGGNEKVKLGNTRIKIGGGEDEVVLSKEVQGIEGTKKIEGLEDNVKGLEVESDPKLSQAVSELQVSSTPVLESEVVGGLNVDPSLSLPGELLSLDTPRDIELPNKTARLIQDSDPQLEKTRKELDIREGNGELENLVLGLRAEDKSDELLGGIISLDTPRDNTRLEKTVSSFPGLRTTPDLSSYLDTLEDPSLEPSLEDRTEELAVPEVGDLRRGKEIRPGDEIEVELGKETLNIEDPNEPSLENQVEEIEGSDIGDLKQKQLRLLGTRFGMMTEEELYQTLIKLLEEDGSDWAQHTLSLVSAYLNSETLTLERAEEFERLMVESFNFPGSSLPGIKKNNLLLGNKTELVPEYRLSGNTAINNGASNYLRWVVEQTIGITNSRGSLRAKLIDEALALEVYGRLVLEKQLGINKDRLPGDDSWKSLLSNIIWNGVSGVLGYSGWDSKAGLLDNAVNLVSPVINALGDKPPMNRPAGLEDEGIQSGSRMAQPPDVIKKFLIDQGGISKWAWGMIPGKPEEESYSINSSEPFNRPASKEGEVRVYYDKENAPYHLYFEDYYNYKQTNKKPGIAKGLETTLRDLCLVNLNESTKKDILYSNVTLEELFEGSDYITTAEKVNKGNVMTLDTNMYWEVTMEPYCSYRGYENEDESEPLTEFIPSAANGGISFLPAIQEINIINKVDHGFETSYTKWVPISGFELQKSKLTTKSLGLFDGEINYPITSEYTNEFRITIVDDQWKSWRHYFQKCSDVAVYNSEPHELRYYREKNSVTRPTAVDKDHLCAAYYKNITFRFRVFVMTPQYSTIRKLDLLCVLKDFSEEYSGEIESGGSDLSVIFSIVGEISGESSEYDDNSMWNVDEDTPKPDEKRPDPPEKKEEKQKQIAEDREKTAVVTAGPLTSGLVVQNGAYDPNTKKFIGFKI